MQVLEDMGSDKKTLLSTHVSLVYELVRYPLDSRIMPNLGYGFEPFSMQINVVFSHTGSSSC